MKKATFQEYTEAKKEIMSGGECKEYASTDEYGRNHKTICCENGEAFWEVTENDVTEFWSTKHPDSRKYEAERELATNVGTNMEEVDYKELAGTCDTKRMTYLLSGREVGKVWEDGMNRAKVMEHYGYKDTQEAHVAMGFWKKESVPERIGLLSEGLLSALDFKKKIRVIFEYDPDFPRAYLRVEGTKEVNVEEAHTDSL